MEQRLSIVTLGVDDLARARRFYEALGWRIATEEGAEAIVAFNLNGLALALYPRRKLAEDAGVPFAAGGSPAITLAYNVASPEAVAPVLARAEAAGARIVKPAQKAFWGGTSGYFADPDGVLWEVAHNPFATLGEDGSFTWA